MNSFRPIFLTAVPQLMDPNFQRKVVLILQHDPEGAFGFVINDPLKITLRDFSASQNLQCHSDIEKEIMLCGGPVEPYRGWILHDIDGMEEKLEVLPGLYISSSAESLSSLLAGGKGKFRVMLGCSGWGPSQLEAELEQGSWIVTPAETKYIFLSNILDIWDGVLHDLGVDPASLALGTGLH